jgi:hypothetical protein
MLEKAIEKADEQITMSGSYFNRDHAYLVKIGYKYGYKQGLKDAKKKAKILPGIKD